MASQGYEGFESISWDAMFAPAGTPPAVIARLNQEITRILRQPDVKKKMEALYFSPAPSTPEQLTALIKTDTERWGGLIDRLHLKLD
jgi:tripartite-type tricarboxylate transporter receptor subunit TctC